MASKTAAARIADGIYKGNLASLASYEGLSVRWYRLLVFLGEHPGMTFPAAVRVFFDRADLEDDLCSDIEFHDMEQWNAKGYKVIAGEHGIVAPDPRSAEGTSRLFGSDQVVSFDGEVFEKDASPARTCGISLGLVMADAQGGAPRGSSALWECAVPFAERAAGKGADVIRRRCGRQPYKDESLVIAAGTVTALLSRAGVEFEPLAEATPGREIVEDLSRFDAVGRAMAKSIELGAEMQDAIAGEINASYGSAALPCTAMLCRSDKGQCLRDTATGRYAALVDRAHGNADVVILEANGTLTEVFQIEGYAGYGLEGILRHADFGSNGVVSVSKSTVLALVDDVSRKGHPETECYIDILEMARGEGTSTGRESLRSADVRNLLKEGIGSSSFWEAKALDDMLANARAAWPAALHARCGPATDGATGLDKAVHLAEELAGGPLRLPEEILARRSSTTPEADERRARGITAAIAATDMAKSQIRRR